MNNKVIVRVKGSIDRVIKKCIDNSIYLDEVNYLNSDEIICKISLNDYKRFKRLNYFSDIKIIEYDGLYKVKRDIKNNFIFIIIWILSFALMDILTSYIVKIEVIHSSSSIRKLIYDELKENNIVPYRISYSYDELERIKNIILDNNKNKLEWVSISKVGMKYIVRCEERKIDIPEEIIGYRHIISKKDAYITKIISNKGENLVRSGDYVKKGAILISGEIKLYDNVMGNTLASGSVFGDVWYNVNVSLPRNSIDKVYTGKKRYNISVNNKLFLKNKYVYFSQNNIREIKLLGIKIKMYLEKEFKYVNKKIDNSKADNIVFEMIDEKFKKKGNIVSKKVLKKDINNSTIDYRVFVICNELISDYKYYEVGDNIDT